MMFYYINKDQYVTSTKPLDNMTLITKEEYEKGIAALQPTEEEIRAQKEALLRQLMLELYPVEEVE